VLAEPIALIGCRESPFAYIGTFAIPPAFERPPMLAPAGSAHPLAGSPIVNWHAAFVALLGITQREVGLCGVAVGGDRERIGAHVVSGGG
jgi:hypothetical protein